MGTNIDTQEVPIKTKLTIPAFKYTGEWVQKLTIPAFKYTGDWQCPANHMIRESYDSLFANHESNHAIES